MNEYVTIVIVISSVCVAIWVAYSFGYQDGKHKTRMQAYEVLGSLPMNVSNDVACTIMRYKTVHDVLDALKAVWHT